MRLWGLRLTLYVAIGFAFSLVCAWPELSYHVGLGEFDSERSLANLRLNLPTSLALAAPMLLSRGRSLLYPACGFAVLALIAAAQLFHLQWVGMYVTPAAYYALFATTPSEAWEFAQTYASSVPILATASLALPFALGLVVAKVTCRGAKDRFADRSLTVTAVALGAVGCAGPILLNGSAQSEQPGQSASPTDLSAYRPTRPVNLLEHSVSAYLGYRDELLALAALADKFNDRTAPVDAQSRNADESETYVLVLGESMSRHHMSLYGYPVPTTPKLELRNEEMVVFHDVIAPHSHTLTSLSSVLTFGDRADGEQGFAKPSVLDLYQAAGFRTYWLSNQHVFGAYDTPITALAKRANVTVHVNSGEVVSYDERLLPALRSALADPAPKKFIVLHLLGAHVQYSNRFPPEFATHAQRDPSNDDPSWMTASHRQTISDYDNAISYQDHVWNEILTALDTSKHRTIAALTADHGEEVYDHRDFFGHTEAIASRHMVDVPLLLWASSHTRSTEPDLLTRWQGAADRVYSTDQLIHTLGDCSELQSPLLDRSRSLLSEEYIVPQRWLGEAPYSEAVDHDPDFAVFLEDPDFGQRVWVHRVNSIERAQIVTQRFDGIEIDLVYDPKTSTFDVRHPPVPSHRLTLEALIESLEHPAKHYYWLDIKRLTPEHSAAAAARLGRIAEAFGLTSRILAETTNAESLTPFAERGFRTSLYLPRIDHAKNWQNIHALENAKRTLVDHPTSGVSQELPMLRRLTPHLGQAPLYTWDRTVEASDPGFEPWAERILSDPRIRVLLVRYDTAGYR